MDEPTLLPALTVVFAAVAVLMAALGLLYSPVAFGVALPFGVAAYVFWYHASGRLRARVVRSARRERATRARFQRSASTGPRGPRFGDQQRMGGGAQRRAGGGARQQRTRERSQFEGLSHEQARQMLGVSADATQGDIRRAYRERAKDLHPDRGGDEAAFRRLNRAYDRLTAE